MGIVIAILILFLSNVYFYIIIAHTFIKSTRIKKHQYYTTILHNRNIFTYFVKAIAKSHKIIKYYNSVLAYLSDCKSSPRYTIIIPQ